MSETKEVHWRDTKEYRVWRATVIMRDRRCVVCNELQGRHAHHINHATYFVDERFDPENGVCLCSKCHMNFHCNFKRSYRTKCTRYDYENFLCLVSYLFGMKDEKIHDAYTLMVDSGQDTEEMCDSLDKALQNGSAIQ